MRRPTLEAHPYRHSITHPYYLDLRPFGQGRKFFKTKAEADAEALRQRTLHQKQSREAVGLEAHELSSFINAKKKLAEYGKTMSDATEHYLDHLERVRRCKTTVAELTVELLDAKLKDGRSQVYLHDLRNRLSIFCRDFGSQPLGAELSA